MILARRPLHQDPRLRFFKLCGSGTGEGFTPTPNLQVWAIMSAFDSEADARAVVAESPVWRRWRKRASEAWTIYLDPISARGFWAGTNPFQPSPDAQAGDGPLVALTRATVKLQSALKFWRRAPRISDSIGANPDVMFKIGIGEVPLLHQVTFSIWPNVKAMAAFARGETPHGRAIRSVREENWLDEELYARFRILGTEGSWEGRDPLSRNVLEKEVA